MLMDLTMCAQDRSQARSMVISQQGIVATSQTLASQAGAQVLARGGSAIDAAIAANAVMGVVEPMSNGMGGDLFAIYWDARTGTLTGINASGWAPAGLTIDHIKRKGLSHMPQLGIDSVTVPGCVEGWARLHQRFGRLPWADLFRPALHFASNGFPVTELIHEYWKLAEKKLAADENARQVYLVDGKAPAVGEVFRNPQLATALQSIAADGPAAFYRGKIAQAILATSAKAGGTMRREDLAEFAAEWVTPISTDYRGWKVYELPPNGQGIATLEMLNLMERFPLPSLPPTGPEALHVKIEAQKLAYQDLHRYVADPRFAKVPVAGLLSKNYARERAALIDMSQAHCEVAPGTPPPSAGDTIYLTVVDRDGDIVSLIQSLYNGFGSGVLVEGMGFHLQNRGGLFDLNPAHPNALAPRKRPFHTIIPGFMEKAKSAHRLRHHGRAQPGAGARAVRLERGGSRHEPAGGARSAPLHKDDLRRLRSADGGPGASGHARTTGAQGSPHRSAGQLLEPGRRRPGRDARCRGGCELRRLGPTQRRCRRPRSRALLQPCQTVSAFPNSQPRWLMYSRSTGSG